MSTTRKPYITAFLGGKLILAAGCGLLAADQALAGSDMTAKKVMTELPAGERYLFVAGMVEGLAVARYYKDDKKKDGMDCILNWFYDDKQTKETIYTAFDRFADYPPASVVHALVKRKCGE